MASIAEATKAPREAALGYPHSREDHPWGQSAFKVGEKTFLFMTEFPTALNLSVKVPVSFEFALDHAFAKPAGYGLGGDDIPMPVLLAWLGESFRAVAPKRLLKAIAPG